MAPTPCSALGNAAHGVPLPKIPSAAYHGQDACAGMFQPRVDFVLKLSCSQAQYVKSVTDGVVAHPVPRSLAICLSR